VALVNLYQSTDSAGKVALLCLRTPSALCQPIALYLTGQNPIWAGSSAREAAGSDHGKRVLYDKACKLPRKAAG